MDTKTTRVPLETTNPTPASSPTPAEDASPPEATAAAELGPDQIQELEEKIVSELCTCFDPEIPVNIYELGLIYHIDVGPNGKVGIKMTLTSPACPAAGSLPGEVRNKVANVPGVSAASVDVVWDPPWDKDRMSEAAKLQLGLFD
jgi:FeS assembly SUF system protein